MRWLVFGVKRRVYGISIEFSCFFLYKRLMSSMRASIASVLEYI